MNSEQKPAMAISTEQLLQLAIAHHQAGRLPEAEGLYRAILQIQPQHPDANHNLGVLATQVKQPVASLPYFKGALEANPNQEQYWLSYLDALVQAGETVAARQVLAQGRQHGLPENAASALEARLGPAPEEISRLVSLFAEARYAEVNPIAQALTERFPMHGVGWKALGLVRRRTGHAAEALVYMQKAVALLPEDAEAHSNLGNVLHELGRFYDAVDAHRRALEIRPDLAEAYNNLGSAMRELGQLDDAVASCRRALELKPDFAIAYSNLGNALQGLGRFNDAVACYRRALELKPDFAKAYSNLGAVLQDLGRLDEAVASYRRALEIKPDYADAHSNLLFTCNYQSEQSAASLLAEVIRYGNLTARKARPYPYWHNVADAGRCLRLGVVSADMRNHPVGYFIESILTALSSQASGRLELVAYSNHFLSDAVTERIKAQCQEWHSAVGLSDERLAQQIRDDGIDILIDLSGHTAHNRLPMFAWKPAPVQVSWLGYFSTTGVQGMDYLIADPWTVPEAEESHFTEKICRLPETYLCFTPPDIDVQVGPLPALDNGRITFGCFNNLTKMNDSVVALWAKVLSAVPGSRLLLKAKQLGEASVCQSVISRFAAHGIDGERLMLEGGAPRAELLRAYQRVDIALDPFPYPGGTTSIEGLWMGVPVLTLAGDRFLSHIGESILHNAGLPEYIATDQDNYVARAVLHAGDLPRLEILRRGLRQQVLDSPLFDAPRFAHHFEAALRGMWVQWCNQQS